MKIGLIWFTPQGEKLAQRLRQLPNAKFMVFDKGKTSAKEFVQTSFTECDGLIFIGAAGIAVRLIAPLLQSKDQDPAVVVLDELGTFAVPILSGHLGGANELAAAVSAAISATLVITTATDVNHKFAVDVWSKKAGCVIGDISKIKFISQSILAGQKVGLASDFPIRGMLSPQVIPDSTLPTGICVSLSESKRPFATTLNVIPRIVTVGVGCRRDTAAEALEKFLLATLQKFDISLKAVSKLASIDLKQDENCIVKFCKRYSIHFETYTAEKLAAVAGDFTASAFVKKTTGVDNVCERSAMCQNDGELLVKKQAEDGMTVAVACRKWRCEF